MGKMGYKKESKTMALEINSQILESDKSILGSDQIKYINNNRLLKLPKMALRSVFLTLKM